MSPSRSRPPLPFRLSRHAFCLLRVFCVAAALLPLSVRAVLVATATDAGYQNGQTSMTMVDGKPAIAWIDFETSSSHKIRYARALDVDGAIWGEPVTVASITQAENALCLRVIHRKPAICFFGSLAGLQFAHAADSTGSAWNVPKSVGPSSSSFVNYLSMEDVNGNPAIAFRRNDGQLFYIRPQDPEGVFWTQPVLLSGATLSFPISMKVVMGQPAILYGRQPGEGQYRRALDETGTAWAPVVKVADTYVDDATMQVADGRPAIGLRKAVMCATCGRMMRKGPPGPQH
jgi:hypothetical protein